jgi:large subunit ribosomal protein L35
MPKMKTKSGCKKRFSFTATGKAKFGAVCKRHNMSKRPKKMIRQARGTSVMNPSDQIILMKYMPYHR